MQHTINKLRFDFACSNEEQAYVLRKNFIDENYNDILSVINAECNHLSNADEFFKFNKLEVNLSVREEVLYNPQKYLDALRTGLRNQLQSKQHSYVEKKSLKERRLQLLTYFLENGSLPWWTPVEAGDIASICHEVRGTNEFSGLIHFLLQHKEKNQIWERVVFQMNDEFKNSLVSEIGVFKEIKEKLTLQLQAQNVNVKVLQESIEKFGEQLNDFILKNGALIFIKTGSNNNTVSPPEINRLLNHFLQLIELPGQTGLFPENKQAVTDQADSLTYVSHSDLEIQDVGQPVFLTDILDSDAAIQAGDQPKEKAFVLNSGIILLNVFLPALFKNLEYWKNGQWVTVNSSTRAVHLMHYLATGKENPFEHELVLEKVLCGIPVSQPVERWIRLTDREKQEANDLLKSMIDHWNALKNTSVTGLRSSFFQREGLLSFKRDSCLLQIERKTMDILLEMLPWGYATVSLPWNPYLIYTEW